MTTGETVPGLLAAVPEPRPEVLARILDGLRNLPDDVPDAAAGAGDGHAAPAVPLPRRRA